MGRSFGEIARGLNAGGVRTAQGGREWWPSTVRAVFVRSTALVSAKGGVVTPVRRSERP